MKTFDDSKVKKTEKCLLLMPSIQFIHIKTKTSLVHYMISFI